MEADHVDPQPAGSDEQERDDRAYSVSSTPGATDDNLSAARAAPSARSGQHLRRGSASTAASCHEPEGPVVHQGVLQKLGGWGVERKQERYAEVRGSTLWLFTAKEVGKKVVKSDLDGGVDLGNGRVIDRGEYLGAHCFSVEGIAVGKRMPQELFLFTSCRRDKWVWLGVLTEVSTDPEEECPASPAMASPRQLSSEVCPVLQYKSATCADCSADDPTWCVTAPFAVFVCIDCIGVHRALHASRCKEAELDVWTDAEVEVFARRGGNEGANAELERAHPGEGAGPLKPRPSSCRQVREAYIRAKYIDRAFADPDKAPAPPPLAADEEASPRTRRYGEPPAYSGVVSLEGVRLQGLGSLGVLPSSCVVVVTNGFQEVRTPPARVKDGDVRWERPLQLPIAPTTTVFYATVLVSSRIYGTAGIPLQRLGDGGTHTLCCPMWGKKAASEAQMWVTATYTGFQ